ncbi:MAG: S46 family peptidase, partial [Bacteroides sp.]|nr:S46 family peptidase [Bacteroides sp.]
MKRLRNLLPALLLLVSLTARADEGMWLLQLMQEQHAIDLMKKQGLQLNALDLYNPDRISIKDAVGIF